eukprot:UN00534
MKAANMAGYEQGVSEWDYYKFTANTPYSPPFAFKIELGNGKEVERENVIATLNENDSGDVSVSAALLVDDENKAALIWTAWFGIGVNLLYGDWWHYAFDLVFY